MTILQIRVDEEVKNRAAAIYSELGLDLSTAVRMFLKRSILVGGIPFETRFDKTTIKGLVAMEKMRDISEQNGNCDMTLDEINEEIKKAREEDNSK